MKLDWKKNTLLVALIILIVLLAGCGGRSAAVTPTPILPTRTPFPPSPTPIPTAAIVNGDLIKSVNIEGDITALMEQCSDKIEEWNGILD